MSAKSLDQVHSATRAFFEDLCSFCNLVPRGGTANKYKGRNGMRQMLEGLMDHALAAAAAAERAHAARQKLKQLQVGIAGVLHKPSWAACCINWYF